MYHSILPDFMPRDSHSLWFTSSRTPSTTTAFPSDHADAAAAAASGGEGLARRAGYAAAADRTLLARLRAEEQHAERRRGHVQNFGSTWLRPPGISKTLYQLREEEREHREHLEILRREQAVQALIEADADAAAAAAAAAAGPGAEAPAQDGDGMSDVQLDGARDLDDDIPDAEFSLDDEDEYGEDEDEDEDEDEVEEDENAYDRDARHRGEARRDILASVRISDDAFREVLARGVDHGDGMYGAEEPDDDDYYENGVVRRYLTIVGDDGADAGAEDADDADMDMDMDADLDADHPDAGSPLGRYEHTDSGEEDASSEGFGRASQSRTRSSAVGLGESVSRHAGPISVPRSPTMSRAALIPRSSLDISGLLSQDESSYLDASPRPNRRLSRR